MDVPDLFLRRWLREQGYRDDEVRRLIRAGALTAVRRGSYVQGRLPAEAEARHGLQVGAALRELAAGVVASHVSAAVVHGLPAWGMSLEQVQVTRARRNGGRRGARVHVRTAALDDGDVTVVAGIAGTSVARTVVDLARCERFEPAVVVADAALFRGMVERSALDAVLERAGRWRGTPDARRVVEFASGLSERVGESRSRVAIARAGLAAPVLQWPVVGPEGRPVGRVDFGWPALRTVGEFDGKVKYGRLLRPGQQAADVVYAEKLREDEIRAADLAVVRWTWADLEDFTATAARLRSRFRP